MKDAKALGIIQGAVSDDIFPRILNEETSEDAWDILHQEFHGDKQVRSIKLQGLRRDFKYTRMRDDETLPVYLTSLLELVNQMKGYEEELPRARLVHKLLISLTKEFDLVCYVIKQTKDIETIEVQEVIAALRGFAQLLDRHAESTTERAFSSMNVNPKELSQIQTRTGNRRERDGILSLRTLSIKVEKMIKRENLIRLRENANIVINYTMVSVGLKGSQNVMVAIDLATSSRIVINQTRLESLVKMGTRDLVQSIGKGTLVIEMKGVPRYIKEVMIVPRLYENLLSVGQMVEHGYWLVFSYCMVDIYGDRQMEDMIASIPMKGNKCFPLGLEYVNPLMANKATVEESSWVWHRRYGHLNYISLMPLQEKEMVQGLPRLQVTEYVCS
ncbi:unnamed protein product [Prunus armeniaca]